MAPTQIEVQLEPNHLIIRCEAKMITEREARECVEKLAREEHERRLIVFDFKSADDITIGALRILTRAAGLLTDPGAALKIICNTDFSTRVKEQGLDRLLQCVSTEDEALERKAQPVVQKNADTTEFLNTLLAAIAHTLKLMAQTEVAPGKSYLRGNGPDPVRIDVAAVIGIVSQPFNGLLVLAFPQETYLKVMSRMFGQDFTTVGSEIKDGAAELLNIILGQVKVPLNEKGYEIKQAIPSVVHGTSVQIFPSTLKPSVIVPYESDAGPFYIEMTTNKMQGKV
jgi:chemotaxis protein CheX